MNLRIARKILRDPHRHSAHQILVAARRVCPGWFDPTETPPMVAYMARSVMGEGHGSRAYNRVLRWYRHRRQGLHDRAWRYAEVPF